MEVAQLPLNAFYRLCARKCDGRLHSFSPSFFSKIFFVPDWVTLIKNSFWQIDSHRLTPLRDDAAAELERWRVDWNRNRWTCSLLSLKTDKDGGSTIGSNCMSIHAAKSNEVLSGCGNFKVFLIQLRKVWVSSYFALDRKTKYSRWMKQLLQAVTFNTIIFIFDI